MYNSEERHSEICDEIKDTYHRKNSTYGNSVSQCVDRYGMVGVATLISIKHDRMVNLIRGAENLVPEESLIDTLKDMANYCIIAVTEIERLKSERSIENGKSDILLEKL